MNESFDSKTEGIIKAFLKKRGFNKDSEGYQENLFQTRSWLRQFDVDEQPFMAELLKVIRVENSIKINRSIDKVCQSLRKKLSDGLYESVFFGLGESPASSGSYFLYHLLQHLGVDSSHAKGEDALGDAVRDNKIIVFIDDIVGSGNQAVSYSKKRIPVGCRAIYCALYGVDKGIENVRKNGNYECVIVANLIREKDRVFSSGSSLLLDVDKRKKIMNIAKKYGKDLYPKHPLGYENSQLLITFPHNVPNNTLPIIWAGPASESNADYWEPLVPRFKAPVSRPVERKTVLTLRDRSVIEKPESYENVQPFDSTKVLDLFVEPEYEFEILSEGDSVFPNKTNFIADATIYINEIQSILVITGPFGCGKTFLAKYLDLSGVLGASNQVLYISAVSLKKNFSKIESLIDGARSCIIDAIDELLVDDVEKEKNANLIYGFLSLLLKKKIKTVVSIRISEANFGRNDWIRSLFEDLYCDVDLKRMVVFKIGQFKKKNVIEWLDKYQSDLSGDQLSYDKITGIHKRLGFAAECPLFLYIFSSYCRRYKVESIYTIYQIYDEFVESTTTGRFGRSSVFDRQKPWQLAKFYIVFLEQIARAINNSKSLRESPSGLDDPDADWRLDNNKFTYTISDDDLRREVDERFLPFLMSNLEEYDGDPRVELLNNYFFTRSGSRIGFKDNNILFFLVAKSIFRSLRNIVDDGLNLLDESLLVISRTKGHPQAVEIVLKRIQGEGEEFRRSLSKRINDLIAEDRIIQLTSQSLGRLSGDSVNRDIILGIVFLYVNRGAYDRIGYFLTRLSWLTSAIKVQDALYRKLIARFFREIELKDVEFRRLNCDDYNFKMTKFAEVKFIQCKLFGSNFFGTVHYRTKFSMCDFGGHAEVIDFSEIQGDISFESCRAGRFLIKNYKENCDLEFRHCHVDEIYIESRNLNSSSKIKLSFENSSIGKLFFENVSIASCKVLRSRVGEVSDKNSKGVVSCIGFGDGSIISFGKKTGGIRVVDG